MRLRDFAVIEVPEGFVYLNGTDAEMVLSEIWGNPLSEGENRSLGLIVPDSINFLNEGYAIDITYAMDGYVKDGDAENIDYDDLLTQMKSDTRMASEYRQENGYESIRLIGWAAEPYYDAAAKKLHWAKELQFGNSDVHTLNYNIRILGRKGYLELNAIGGLEDLPEINASIDPILANVNFVEGHRYEDFDDTRDKVAAYGIGGLIAGGVLAKSGMLAKIGVLLAKSWKLLAVGGIALMAGIRKFFGGGK